MMSWNVSPVILPPAALGVITPTAATVAESVMASTAGIRRDAAQSPEALLRKLIPSDSAPTVEPGAVYRQLDLPAGVDGRPYVVMNMVSTVDGKAALGKSAAGIGSRTDSLLMRQIRAAVDAVMHGAGTLRSEIVDPRVDLVRSRQRVSRGMAPQPLAIAVSGSLDLDPTSRFLVNGPSGTVILTSSAAPADCRLRLAPYAALVICDTPTLDLESGLRRLHDEFGVRRLLVEGGPTLNQHLLDAGLVDEVFWTIAPKLAGGRGRAIIDSDEPTVRIAARLDLVALHEHDGELFARYRLRRGPNGRYLT